MGYLDLGYRYYKGLGKFANTLEKCLSSLERTLKGNNIPLQHRVGFPPGKVQGLMSEDKLQELDRYPTGGQVQV